MSDEQLVRSAEERIETLEEQVEVLRLGQAEILKAMAEISEQVNRRPMEHVCSTPNCKAIPTHQIRDFVPFVTFRTFPEILAGSLFDVSNREWVRLGAGSF